MKYLIIQTRDIGDVMLTSALCNALKAAYPQAEVDFLTMDYCAGVVDGNPNIDEIIVMKKSLRNNFSYMFNLLKTIRSKKYDAIVNLQGQIVGLLTCLFSLSSRRIGKNRFPWRLAHTDNIDLPGPEEPSGYGHAVDVRFALLAPLLKDVEDKAYKIWLSELELQTGRKMLEAAGLDMTKAIVAFGVNSRDHYKQWPIQYFADTASWLLAQYDIQIYIFFGPGEEAYSKSLKSLLPENQQHLIFDDVHTGNIRELAMVFSHCALYVGNDTGPRHIAQAVNMPAFAVVSPASNKWWWMPWKSRRYKAVDAGDALGLSDGEWLDICSKLTAGVDDAEWFLKLDPGFVQSRLAAMIKDLRLFTNTVDNSIE